MNSYDLVIPQQIHEGKEKNDKEFHRQQTVVNVEDGAESITVPELPFERLFEKTTEELIAALKNHDIAILGGVSGSGKSELFLFAHSFIKGANIQTAGLVNFLNAASIPYTVLDGPQLLPSTMDSLKDSEPVNRRTQRLKDSQFIIIDESMGFIQNSDFLGSLRDLLSFAKKGNKKIIFMGGGKLDGKQQNKMLAELFSSIGESVEDEQLVEFKPTLLTDVQAKGFLMKKDFTEEQAARIVEKIDQLGCPLIIRVLLNIFPPVAPGQPYNFDEYLASNITEELKIRHADHLKLTQNLH